MNGHVLMYTRDGQISLCRDILLTGGARSNPADLIFFNDTSTMVRAWTHDMREGYNVCPECRRRLLTLHYHLLRVMMSSPAECASAEQENTCSTSTET